jgi:uncharacterized integral membrane protein
VRILIAVALILSLLVTIFAVQNNAATTVRFLFWSVDGSFALVLMVTLITEILVGIMLMVPGSVRNRLKAAELKRKLNAMDQQVGELPFEVASEAPGMTEAEQNG